MKRIISVAIAVLLLAGSLSACASGSQPQPAAESEAQPAAESEVQSAAKPDAQPVEDIGNIRIVTTIFPIYDWVMNILGDNPANADVTMLLDTGVDLDGLRTIAADVLKISDCDLFIYVGGESDEWVDDTLQEAANKDMVVVDLLDVLGDSVKEEELIEGMQEEEHDHGEGEIEYDEHVWLSLKNAAVLVNNISDAVQKIDPAHAEAYQKNAAAYREKLNALDAEYQAAVSSASYTTLLFGDRFPFRYLVDDYGLTYYAAFVGCSAETEASFETITFLAQKVDELSLPAVMTIEGTDHRIAETIVLSTASKDQQILTMDSMQSVTTQDVEDGTSYLSIMENNLSVMKDALK